MHVQNPRRLRAFPVTPRTRGKSGSRSRRQTHGPRGPQGGRTGDAQRGAVRSTDVLCRCQLHIMIGVRPKVVCGWQRHNIEFKYNFIFESDDLEVY